MHAFISVCCLLHNVDLWIPSWWTMLASRSVRISRMFSRALVRCYVSAPTVKPFHYQQLLEHEKTIDTPYKKLTGKCWCLRVHLQLINVIIYFLCFYGFVFIWVCLYLLWALSWKEMRWPGRLIDLMITDVISYETYAFSFHLTNTSVVISCDCSMLKF